MKKIMFFLAIIFLAACGENSNSYKQPTEYTAEWQKIARQRVESLGCSILEIELDGSSYPYVQCDTPSSLDTYTERHQALKDYIEEIQNLESESTGDKAFNSLLIAKLSISKSEAFVLPQKFDLFLASYEMSYSSFISTLNAFSTKYSCSFIYLENDFAKYRCNEQSLLRTQAQELITQLEKDLEQLRQQEKNMKGIVSRHDYYDPLHEKSSQIVWRTLSLVEESILGKSEN